MTRSMLWEEAVTCSHMSTKKKKRSFCWISVLREQFPLVGVLPVLVTGLLPAFPGRAMLDPSCPQGWLWILFVLQTRGGVCISEPCSRSTAHPTGVVARTARGRPGSQPVGQSGQLARGQAGEVLRAASLASKKRRCRDSTRAAWLCPREMPPRSSARSSRSEQGLGVGQVLGPAPAAGSVPVPLGQLARRGFGNDIPNNFTVVCFVLVFFFIFVICLLIQK